MIFDMRLSKFTPLETKDKGYSKSLTGFTIFLSIYIIISSSFMQQVWDIWKEIFGVRLLILFFILLCLLAVSAILYKNIKSKSSSWKIVVVSTICILGFIFAWKQPYLPEKAHVLEFALLGWLTINDLVKQNRYSLKNILRAFVFVTIIGYLEEGFQKFLPWRVFEIRDIITDMLGGILGIILNLLSQIRFSSFIGPL